MSTTSTNSPLSKYVFHAFSATSSKPAASNTSTHHSFPSLFGTALSI